ncbi:MAG: hypothetical protein KKB50_18425 [Planctomycetes bacterium]|nr:hypothetical protein [Planctomycetota bacterium]
MKRLIGLGLGLGVLGLCYLGLIGMSPQDQSQTREPAQAVPVLAELLDYSLQALDVPEHAGEAFSTVVSLGSERYALTLEPFSLRSDDFRLLVQGADGELREVPAPPAATYRGVVEAMPGSAVTATLVDGELSAIIDLAPGEQWAVQPLSKLTAEPVERGLHVVYRGEDVALTGPYKCGADDIEQPFRNVDRSTEAGGDAGGGIANTGYVICEIACDADVEFYNWNGSDVVATMQDIETVVNRFEDWYERDVAITYEVTTIVVRTAEPDPYTSTNAGTLLDQLRSEWNANMDDVKRDTAQLFTGKDLDGGTIGVSWLSTICDESWSYSLVESNFSIWLGTRACLSAHELGHSWDAGHCDGDADCYIMCSGLGGCAGVCNEFGSRSIGDIASFRNSLSCLKDEPDWYYPPFSDTFPSTTIDGDKWVWRDHAAISSNAVNEPSAPYSLNLDATGSGEYEDDQIRTHFIQMDGGETSITVSYYTQHRGVESGEKLVVEYWSQPKIWVELNTIVSDGVDQDNFVYHEHTLTNVEALWNQFRVRFRTEVNSVDDDWYIDDFSVTAGSATAYTLSVGSTPLTGVSIQVSPLDNNSNGAGTTGFDRVYDDGTDVTLTAPVRPTVGGDELTFCNWDVDGANQADGQLALVHTVGADAALTSEYLLVGDMNGDDAVNGFDIDLFIEALDDQVTFEATYGPCRLRAADTNGDGNVNGFDIDGFILLLG